MLLPSQLLALPQSLLWFLAATRLHAVDVELQWPQYVPQHLRLFPESEQLYKRHEEVRHRMAMQSPLGIRKMSGDPSEMFFVDYWGFDGEQPREPGFDLEIAVKNISRPAPEAEQTQEPHRAAHRARSRDVESFIPSANSTVVFDLLPPLLLHSTTQSPLPKLPRNLAHLFPRSFQCPQDTQPCNSIARPNSCCSTSETCVLIPDTGLGDVGCCPRGQSCSGSSVGSCNAQQGYTSCPNSSNGGCCIPNFTCEDIGCVAGSTSTTTTGVIVTETVTPGANTVTSTSSPSLSPVTTTQTILDTATFTETSSSQQPSTVTVYTTLTPATTTAIVIANSAAPSSACPSAYQSCAASLGGGCCPIDRACGSSSLCLPLTTATATATTTVASAAPPVRPTSDNPSSASAPEETYAGSGGVCPTGYYMCSAYYMPGACCQVGRDCSSTSCPIASSRTVISNGQTIVVPAGAPTGNTNTQLSAQPSTAEATTTTEAGQSVAGSAAGSTITAPPDGTSSNQGACAVGWSACGTQDDGGCCPTGYQCGITSCMATDAGQAAKTGVPKGGLSSGCGQSAQPFEFLGSLRKPEWGRGIGILAGAAIGVGVGLLVL